MEYRRKPVITEAMKTTRVVVYDYSNKTMQGSFYNLYYGQEVMFSSLMEFLLQMETLMDEMQCPQATTETRLAYKTKGWYEATKNCVFTKKAAPVMMQFCIRVIFRKNSSWQGTITWGKDKREKSFRSTLELVKLMDNILTRQQMNAASSDLAVEVV